METVSELKSRKIESRYIELSIYIYIRSAARGKNPWQNRWLDEGERDRESRQSPLDAGEPSERVRQYKGGDRAITIFHSFVRSNYFVQLKYRFSPPSLCAMALLLLPRVGRVDSRELAYSAYSPLPPFHLFCPSILDVFASASSTVSSPHAFPLSSLQILFLVSRWTSFT